MTGSGRQPGRALLALVAAFGLVLAAGILPMFGAAAPAGEVAREIGALASSGADDADESPSVRAPGGSGGSGGGPGGSGGPGLGDSGVLGGDTSAPLVESLLRLVGGPSGSGGGSGGGVGAGGGGGAGGSGGGSGGGGGGGLFGGGGGGAGGSGGGGGSGGSGGGGLFGGLFGGGGDGGSSRSGGPGDNGGSQAGSGADGGCLSSGEYRLCFDSELAAGSETTVRVTRGGEPASGVVVTFDGEAVGRTDADGEVTATVPYVRQLSVGVRAPASAIQPVADRQYSLAQPDDGAVTVTVDSDLRIEVADDPDPGGTVGIRTLVGDRPVPDATVRVDGETVGRTDRAGRLQVPLPVAETATVAAERGDLAASRSLTLARVEVALGAGLVPVAVPGQPTTVTVTDGGEPVTNASVAVAGGATGRTDANGTVRATLPLAPTTDVTVTTAAGLTVTRSKAIFVGPLVALLLLLGLLGAVGYVYRQSEVTGRGLLAQARATLSALAADLLSALVGLSSGIEGVLSDLREELRGAIAAVSAPDVSVRAFVRERLAALRAAVRGALGAPLARFRDRGGTDTDTGTATAAAAPDRADPRERIERLWARFVRRVGLTRARTRTPGEVAGRGVSRGLPAESVERLTDAFRVVEYSDADPAAHVEAATDAAGELDLDGDAAADETDGAGSVDGTDSDGLPGEEDADETATAPDTNDVTTEGESR
ncbi:DUF4129 domain-containing protein [Haloglomus salinum]|uniref:DUF4129 domain-containing protein n=1 Tax=Haloglomus salinum TaxID=2962673 RepID=UPI00257832F9|nr:DUF4129 domain-containing protein [Haloglomus salinum]